LQVFGIPYSIFKSPFYGFQIASLAFRNTQDPNSHKTMLDVRIATAEDSNSLEFHCMGVEFPIDRNGCSILPSILRFLKAKTYYSACCSRADVSVGTVTGVQFLYAKEHIRQFI
jgi:hypothetical protein